MRRLRVAGLAAAAGIAAVALATVPVLPAAADAVRDAEYWLDEYGIRAAWSVTQGAGVTIAIIDTGVDPNVAELRGAVLPGADFSGIGDPSGQAPVGDDGAHGTLVASLAAGRGRGPNTGVIGVAPGATILPVSIGFGTGTGDSDAQIAQAVRYAVDAGAKVINMSLTRNTLEWPQSWDDAFLYAMEHDVVVVAAAGNRSSGTTVVGAPATMPGVLTVAGVDRDGNPSVDASSQGITIGVAAPSEELVGVMPGGGYVLWDGTSGAAPIVSGIVALVRAAHPELDAANVIQRIIATARDAGAPGADPLFGFGLVDANAAVTASVPLVGANPLGDLAEWVRLYRPTAVEPAPLPTPVVVVPEPEVIVDAGLASPVGELMPSIELLRGVGIPALVIAAFLAGLVVIGTWAFRRIEGSEKGR